MNTIAIWRRGATRLSALSGSSRMQTGRLGCHWVRGQTPVSRPCCEHAYHLYVTRVKQRNALMKYLTALNIPAVRHYPAAVHHQPAYAALAQRSPSLANTDALVPEILSLPLHP